MSTTSDPNDPNLTRGSDTAPTEQAKVYLVLSDEERAKGFRRRFRDAYRHVGERPAHPTRELTPEETELHQGAGFVLFEVYPENMAPETGRYWTAEQLKTGCGAETRMARSIAETYARDPKFYGSTYCVGCRMHRPVAEFIWSADGSVLGT